MFNVTKILVSTALLLSISGMAQAKCPQPILPQLPNAQTAVLAQVIKADKDAKRFIDKAGDFKRCSRNNTKLMRAKYDLKKLRSEHKALVAQYKARMKDENSLAQNNF